MFWRDVIRDVDRRLPAGLKTAKVHVDGVKTNRLVLQDVLVYLGAKFGEKYFGAPKGVSVSQYYRKRKALIDGGDVRDLEPNTRARGNRHQLLPEVKKILRDTIAKCLDEAGRTPRRGATPTTSMRDIAVKVFDELEELKRSRPDLADKIKLPCKTTFYETLKMSPARVRARALLKGVATEAEYRRPYGHERPEHALSDTQYDETRLPMYCYCDVLKIPLGRPWLSWLVDIFSNSILGFYLGFEPPGDAVFASVFRHAVMPKAYIGRIYPDIAQPYLMSGMPRFVTFDNSLSAHGNTIDRLLGDLDIHYDFTLPRMPWLKGMVEADFKAFNLGLLAGMPGFVLPKEVHAVDYDPRENGVIGFMHLLWIVHRYVLERYHPHPPTIGGPSPNSRWLAGTRIVKPRYPRQGQDLDFLFGIVREGVTLDHRGVMYENIRYYSDGADNIRYWKGANVKVTLKINPVNLSSVLARFGDECWVRCYALDPAEGRTTLHYHKLRQRHSERLYGKTDWQSRVRADADLRRVMAGAVDEDHGTRVSGLLARALGIGTHVVFDRLALERNVLPGDLASVPPPEAARERLPAPSPAPGQAAPATLVPATPVPGLAGPPTVRTPRPARAGFAVRSLPPRSR